MNFKKHIVKFISCTMSAVLMLMNFTAKSEAKRLNDYNVHISKSRRPGVSFSYKKNDDGENTITLLNINKVKKDIGIDITSPIDSYDVTKVEANFCNSGEFKVWKPFFKTLSNNTKIFFKNAGVTFTGVALLLTPFVNIFAACAPGALFQYESFESYKEDIRATAIIKNINLPKCLEIGQNAFRHCYELKNIDLPKCSKIGEGAFQDCYELEKINLPECSEIEDGTFLESHKLAKVNLPKCTKIGEYAFACNAPIRELCVSKNIDLQSHHTRNLLQKALDNDGILKYADEKGKEVQVHSLKEFTNFNKNR